MEQILFINWDIGSEPGIQLGPLLIRYYSLMWILAFVLGLFVMKKIFTWEKVDLKYIDPFFMYSLIGCVLGARLGEVFFYQWAHYQDNLIEILLPIKYHKGESIFGIIEDYEFTGFAGLASHGATVGLMISTYLFHRKYKELNLLWLFDRLVLAVPLGGAAIRLGNFFNSEIVGKFSDLPWAVRFPNIHPDYQSHTPKELLAQYGGFIPRHPAQLYEALGYIILFVILFAIYKKTDKKNLRGWLFGAFLVGLFLIRFIVEFFKEPQDTEPIAAMFGNVLNNGQLLSIPFIILGFVLMYMAKPYTQSPVKQTNTK